MNVLERLENRRLLSDVALDLTFGDAGSAPEGGSLLVAPLADGKILTVTDHSDARLNADGSVDPTFQLPGGALDGVFLSEVFVVKNATRLFLVGVGDDDGRTPFIRAFHLSDGS